MVQNDLSLTELRGVGPWLARIIQGLLEDETLEPPAPPEIRRDFLTRAEVQEVLASAPEWAADLQGDLQMQTTYSDGKATLREMAHASADLGYRFVAITDHSKGLRIARGMDEAELAEQAEDVAALNQELRAEGRSLSVLHAIEINVSPEGEGDMEPAALRRLDLVLGAFHSNLRLTEDQTDRYLKALRNPELNVLAHPRAGSTFGRAWPQTGAGYSRKRRASTRQSRSTPTQTGRTSTSSSCGSCAIRGARFPSGPTPFGP